MKRIAGLLLVALFLALTVFLTSRSDAGNIEFTEEALKNVPEKQGFDLQAVPSYDITPYDLNRDAVNSRAGQIIKSNPVVQASGGKKFSLRETSDDIVFYSKKLEFRIAKATGAEMLLNLEKYTVADKDSEQKSIRAEDIKDVADKYIKEQFSNISSNDIRFVRIKKIMDAVQAYDKQSGKFSQEKVRVANYIALYERVIKGIPVIGPGEKIRVYLSSRGVPLGHSLIWRSISGQVSVTKPVLSSDDIKGIFIKSHGENPARTIKVDRIYFGYYADGRYTQQKVLSPYYMIGFTYGPHSKRVFERYDAYTGEFLKPPADEPGDKKVLNR